VQSRARASAGRWAGGLSSGEFPAGIGMAVAGAGPRPDLPLGTGHGNLRTRDQRQRRCQPPSASICMGTTTITSQETAHGAPVVCRRSRLEIWPSPWPESRRQWESRGQGRMPQGSRRDVACATTDPQPRALRCLWMNTFTVANMGLIKGMSTVPYKLHVI
jgi:hypothetical protein